MLYRPPARVRTDAAGAAVRDGPQGRQDRRRRVQTRNVAGLDPRPVLGLQPHRLPHPAQQQLSPPRPTRVDPDRLQPSHQQLDRVGASEAMNKPRWIWLDANELITTLHLWAPAPGPKPLGSSWGIRKRCELAPGSRDFTLHGIAFVEPETSGESNRPARLTVGKHRVGM